MIYLNNGYRIYVDIMTGENWRSFRLPAWTSLNVQFVHPVEEKGMGLKGMMKG